MIKNLSVKKIKSSLLFIKFCVFFGAILVGIVSLKTEIMRPEIRYPFFAFAWYAFIDLLIDIPILYYCAFKKRGSGWLTFSILCYIISFSLSAVSLCFQWILFSLNRQMFLAVYLEKLRDILPHPKIANVYPHFATMTMLYLFGLSLGYRTLKYYFALRARNNIYQYKITLKSPEKSQACRVLDESTTKEELNSNYKNFKHRFAGTGLIKFLRFKYKKRKTQLTKP